MSSPDLGPEHLPTVPHLKSNGSNWVVFATRFQEVMLAAHRWVYIVGTTTRPVPKDADNPTRAEKEATEAWEDEDQFTGYLLTTKLPDWLAISIDSHPIYSMAKTQWDKVIEELRHEVLYHSGVFIRKSEVSGISGISGTSDLIKTDRRYPR